MVEFSLRIRIVVSTFQNNIHRRVCHTNGAMILMRQSTNFCVVFDGGAPLGSDNGEQLPESIDFVPRSSGDTVLHAADVGFGTMKRVKQGTSTFLG